MQENGMRKGIGVLIKVSAAIAAGLLFGWMCYWAGFSKALQIGQYINQRRDLSQSAELDQLARKLESGNVEEVRTHLKSWGDILKEQVQVQAEGAQEGSSTVVDLLVPTGGLSLIRDYKANRSEATRPRSSREEKQ
jgi:hypothetical protein